MVEATSFTLLRWILLPPLVAAAVHAISLGVLRRPLPRSATLGLSVGAPALSFVVSLVALIELAGAPEAVLVDDLFTWVAAGDFGAEFALLPPQNATGNWVKVVQRIPVSLRLERSDDEPVLRAGMTVTVSIDTERVRGLPDFVPEGIASLRLPGFLRRALALDESRRE